MYDLRPPCAELARQLLLLRDGDLGRPTPCDDWDVAALVDHVGDVAASDPDADDTGLDRVVRVARDVAALPAAWADPGAWTGESEAAGLTLPNATWGRIMHAEVVVHGWDLSCVSGAAWDLPERTLREALAHLGAFVPTAPVEGLWGPPVAVGPQASTADRLLAVAGRRA